MKLVQIGILVALVVTAGMLFMVWRGQHQEPALTAASVQPPDVNAAPAPPPDAAAQTLSPVEDKPAPAPVVKSSKKPHTAVAQNMPPQEPAPAAAPPPEPPAPPVQAPPEQASPEPPVQPAVQEPPPAPAPPPPPRSVTIAPGTNLHVRLIESLSSDKNQPGDAFSATLDQPLIVDGFVIAERGARVDGKVAESRRAGRVKGVSDLSLQLVRLHTSDGQTVAIQTDPFEKEGDTSHKSDAEKVGGGAALGAIIGAIAGGGRGAAIGAGAGGAAGGGTVLATRGKAVVLPSETKLTFRLTAPVTLTEKRH